MTRSYSRTRQDYLLRPAKYSVAVALTLGVSTMWLSAAWAQADATSTDTETTDVPKGFEEFQADEVIVVEARRREESLQDVPITIQAMSEDALKDAGVRGAMGLSQFSPSLNVSSDVDNNGARFFIRGVGTATPLFGSENAVPIYIDDVYTPLGLGGNFDIFSIDRVEVLSGPQGTLYGRNSFGGAVKIYSKEFTDETDIDLTLQAGSFGQRNIKAEVLTPVIQDRLWVGAAFAKIKNDGIQKFVELGNNIRGWEDDKELYRLRLKARPVDDLTINASYWRSDSEGVARQNKIEPGTRGDLSSLYLAPTFGDEIDPMPSLTETHPDHIETNVASDNSSLFEITTWKADYALSDNINLIYLGGDHRLENLRAIDNDGGPEPFLQFIQDFVFDAQSHELQLQWNSDRYNVVLGGFYYEEDSSSFSAAQSNFGPATFINSQDSEALSIVSDINGLNTAVDSGVWNKTVQETESLAFFTNIGVDLTDKLRGTIGVRWTRDDKFQDPEVENQNFVVDPSIMPFSGDILPSSGVRTLPLPGGLSDPNNFGFNFGQFEDLEDVEGVDAFGPTGPVQQDFEEVTVEATLDYRLTPNTLTFASFKQGFQGGTLFPNVFANLAEQELGALQSFDQFTSEQKLNAYEVGLKTTLFDGRWQLNGAAYYYDFEDLIISVQSPVPEEVVSVGFLAVPKNAGKARTIGFDFNTTFRITDNLALRANLGFFDFKLQEVQSANLETGELQNIASDFNDRDVAGAPRWQGALGIEYFAPETRYGRARLWLNAALRSRMNTFGGDIFGATGFGLLRTKLRTLDPATGSETRIPNPNANKESFLSEPHENISAGVSWTTVDDDWRVRIDLSGFNLLDQRRFENTPVDSPGVLGLSHGYNKPRRYLLSVTYSR